MGHHLRPISFNMVEIEIGVLPSTSPPKKSESLCRRTRARRSVHAIEPQPQAEADAGPENERPAPAGGDVAAHHRSRGSRVSSNGWIRDTVRQLELPYAALWRTLRLTTAPSAARAGAARLRTHARACRPGAALQRVPHWRRRRGDVPPRLRDGPRRHHLEARRLALQVGRVRRLGEGQEPGI